MHSMREVELQQGLAQKIGALIGLPTEEIDITMPLAEYGLDSVHGVGLSGEIQEWLGIPVDPTLAWDYPTIEQMAHFLACP